MKRPDDSRRLRRMRLVAAAVVSAGLLVPLAVFGGTGFAAGQTPSAAEYQYKITICHHTHSAKNPTVTIRISSAAWKAHQKHGDTLGACAAGKAKHGNNGKSGSHPSKPSHPSQAQNGQSNPGKGHGK